MRIASIVVLYKPDLELFSKVLQSICGQVKNCIIVNNGNEEFHFDDFSNITLLTLGENRGIAYAQNRGIEKAIELDADYVLLSDQDTVYPPDYIDNLFKTSEKYEYDVLCPVFYDETKKESSPIMLSKFKFIQKADSPLYVEHAIASGTIIKTSIFQKVGMMNEKLFIDYVDFEWCWRLKHFGGKLLCCPNVTINHHLGDDYKKILGKKVCIRSNFRYFYMIRNGLQLSLFYPLLNFKERVLLFKKTILLCVAVLLLRKNFDGLKTVLNGLKAGGINQSFFDDLRK